jgi:hypothetical protein
VSDDLAIESCSALIAAASAKDKYSAFSLRELGNINTVQDQQKIGKQ